MFKGTVQNNISKSDHFGYIDNSDKGGLHYLSKYNEKKIYV